MPGLVPLVTTMLAADPTLAPRIIEGLATGKYRRVGGVIISAANGRVVTWLRSVGDVIPPTLSPILQFGATTSILTLGVTALGLSTAIFKLEKIEQQLNVLREQLANVGAKLDISFYANFRVGLAQANDALQMQGAANRRVSAHSAINRLLEAEQVYTSLLDKEYESGLWAAPAFLDTLALAYVSAAHCYLEIEEIETARRHLANGVNHLRAETARYYKATIGSRPSLCLHPELASEIYLDRLTQLGNEHGPSLTPSAHFERLRAELWNTAAGEDAWLDRMPAALFKQPSGWLEWVSQKMSTPEKIRSLLPGIARVFHLLEALTESIKRADGYVIELEYVAEHGIPLEEWQRLDLQIRNEDDVMLVFPEASELLCEEPSITS